MSYQSPIRDLIMKLDAVAQDHIAFPQVCDAMRFLREHLSALAYHEEVNRQNTAAYDAAMAAQSEATRSRLQK